MSPEISSRVTAAEVAWKRGDLQTALSQLDSAKSAGGEGREAVAGVSLRMARDLETSPAPTGERTQELTECYKLAVATGTPQQRAAALNNLGTLHLRNKDYTRALDSLTAIQPDAVPESDRFAYAYNTGRAYELSGQREASASQYRQALRLNPRFDRAAEGLFRLSLASSEPRLHEDFELVTNLLSRGRTDVPRRYFQDALPRFAGQPQAALLLAGKVRYYVAVALTPAQFNREERPALLRAAEQSKAMARLVQELDRAFNASLEPIFTSWAASTLFPAWTTNDLRSTGLRSAFSALLKMLGDQHARPRDPGAASPAQALACYSSAWAVDSSNLEAALYTAATLRDHREALGGHLQPFLDALFELKGGAYRVRVKSEADWLTILRCHLVLSSIYEDQGRWGDEMEVQSAVFQLTHALEAEKKVQEFNPKFPSSPRLLSRLANAQVRRSAPRLAEAWDLYLRAGETSLEQGDRKAAQEALDSAARLPPPRDRDRQVRLRRLQSAIRQP